MKLSDADRAEVTSCLNMRKCWIETGTVTMRATDAQQYNRTATNKIKINALTDEQQQYIQNLNRIEMALLRGK